MQITEDTSNTHERVVTFTDDDFQCVIALHNTKLGPALGGCRVQLYPDFAAQTADALLLSEAMTYKNSLAGLDLGGGKAVINAARPTRDIMLKFGDAVNSLKGAYITAEDVGTNLTDLAIIAEVCPHLCRTDGSGMTARGVLTGMTAGALFSGQWGHDLEGVPIWVQGLGKVGLPLAMSLLRLDHPNVYVSDLDPARVTEAQKAGAYLLSESDRRFMAIYAPCALGNVVTADNVQSLTYTIICGAANNQLADDTYADILHENAVLYLPDFLVNAGGVIHGACEIDGVPEKAESLTDAIGERVMTILEIADSEDVPPLTAAKRMAKSRL